MRNTGVKYIRLWHDPIKKVIDMSKNTKMKTKKKSNSFSVEVFIVSWLCFFFYSDCLLARLHMVPTIFLFFFSIPFE